MIKAGVVEGIFYYVSSSSSITITNGIRATIWIEEDPLRATAIEFILDSNKSIIAGESCMVQIKVLGYRHFEKYFFNNSKMNIGFGSKKLIGHFYPSNIIQKGNG